jgi:hypothetical protein
LSSLFELTGAFIYYATLQEFDYHYKKRHLSSQFFDVGMGFARRYRGMGFASGWALQAAIKDSGPLYAVVEPFPTNIYVVLGGKQAQREIMWWYIKRCTYHYATLLSTGQTCLTD